MVDLDGIENIFLRNADTPGGGLTLDASDWDGVNQVWNNRSNNDVTVNSVQSLATVGIRDTTSATTVTFADSVVSGSDDTLSIAADNAGSSATAATLSVDDASASGNVIEGVEVSASGDNNLDLTNVGNAVESITLTGDGSVDLAADQTALTSVDASANSGGVDADLTGNGNNVTFTGGSGDDAVAFASGDFDDNDSVDGGDGTDTINLQDGGDLTEDSGAAVTSFETLDVGGGTGTYDLDFLADVSSVVSGATLAGGVVIDNAGADVGLDVTNSTGANSITINQDGAGNVGSNNDSLSVSVGGSAAVTTDAIIAANIEQLDVTSQGDAGNTIGDLQGSDATTVNVTGSQDLTFSDVDIASNATVDASSLDGALSVTDGDAGFNGTIIGTAEADTINVTDGGASTATILGGDGADAVDLDSGAGGGGGAQQVAYSSATDGAAETDLTDDLVAGDTIANFETTTDQVVVTGDLRSNVTTDTVGTSGDLDSEGLVFSEADLGGSASYTTLSTVTNNISISNEAAGDVAVFVVHDTDAGNAGAGADAGVYAFTSVTADDAITEDEIQLLGTVNSDVAQGDFVFG